MASAATVLTALLISLVVMSTTSPGVRLIQTVASHLGTAQGASATSSGEDGKCRGSMSSVASSSKNCKPPKDSGTCRGSSLDSGEKERACKPPRDSGTCRGSGLNSGEKQRGCKPPKGSGEDEACVSKASSLTSSEKGDKRCKPSKGSGAAVTAYPTAR
jgi:hypothetical protein